jgi:hypothetical protein
VICVRILAGSCAGQDTCTASVTGNNAGCLEYSNMWLTFGVVRVLISSLSATRARVEYIPPHGTPSADAYVYMQDP